WTIQNATIGGVGTPSPLQGHNLNAFLCSTTKDFNVADQFVTLAATRYVVSLVAKAGRSSNVSVGIGGHGGAQFDLANGTVMGVTAGVAGIIDLGDGHYRCWLNVLATAGSKQIGVGCTAFGDGVTPDIYVGLVQVEEAVNETSGPTSYVHNETTATTRASDGLSYPGAGNHPAGPRTLVFDAMLTDRPTTCWLVNMHHDT